jgi:hypothetical protein
MDAINIENIHASLQANRLPNASTESGLLTSEPLLAADPIDFWASCGASKEEPAAGPLELLALYLSMLGAIGRSYMAAHSTSRDFRSRNDITCLILKRGVCIALPVRCWLHAALLTHVSAANPNPAK